MSDSYRFGKINGPVNTGNPHNEGGSQIVGRGDIRISGGNHVTNGLDPAVAEALVRLRGQLDDLRLTGSERAAAVEDLAGVERAADDKPAAASAFESFLTRLTKAGALAEAGADFTEAVGKILRWLGPLAAGAIALL